MAELALLARKNTFARRVHLYGSFAFPALASSL
jgi:hypothetical protein